AKVVCQEGLGVGHSAITTLGDPTKGVYLCRYSDFLHPAPWLHKESGCLVIFKVIQGRVKSVAENYTDDFTSPSPGYDCHVSPNLRNDVSCATASRFELTQYYVYEFGQSDGFLRCPRQLCPYALVEFQYCGGARAMRESVDEEM
uniref:TASOR pseudo-PARP domain-containing protein n=1 Tax=Callorhinchus milii TaxID=7868 RepID=A0A4W3IZU5_CALMI